ncbi:UDP-N-acetylglucosamine 2-epimerase (non-hydrolyzing) [candidate division LCP-89 bacterium B3_LCP]|uniref:UDP-N-acetylglucosamine 2-epimerase (Non-hydrolyzing) n=1 Tax=candidate division LCP-89 bacterium B3_LCP TaxID=2012998 RepID=A0A532V3J3_UNCL8|nr:MAG: UDP-N-acetylglucosamine 2-epimerase (non-hydrolyzing) [candidate division LCP-89 bacterium B3_LCP]
MLRVFNVVGARPNFIKIAPILKEMFSYPDLIDPVLINTGQHYDQEMVDFFFADLDIPKPDISLGVGSGSHAQQTAKVMMEFEPVCLEREPDLILVVGDVNSTLACSLVGSKLGIKIAHVESGLRSFDRAMPEEINREVTDLLSDFLFTTSSEARDNLSRLGIPEDRVFFVGNVMIDSLNLNMPRARQRTIIKDLGLQNTDFSLMTLHRPSNVDDYEIFSRLLGAIDKIQKRIKLIFPAHPRTVKNIEKLGLSKKVAKMKNLQIVSPLGYLDFLALMDKSKFVLTDSGGLQEETTVLGVPCLTLRKNTERPVTITVGTNILVGLDADRIVEEADKALNGKAKMGSIPPLWDGYASQRIVKNLIEQFSD